MKGSINAGAEPLADTEGMSQTLSTGRAVNRTPTVSRCAAHFQITVTLLLAIVFSLGIGELALRFLWHNPYRHERPDSLLRLRIHHPNSDQVFSRALIYPQDPEGRLRTDARSYILPSFQHAKPDATIAFLGGSTTECSAVREELRFPALVSTRFEEQHGYRVNTLNVARSGNTLHDSINVFFNHVTQDRPDIVVLMHASNDIGVLSADGDYRSRIGLPATWADLGKWGLQILSSDVYLGALVRKSLTSGVIRPSDPKTDWRNDPASAKHLPETMFRQRLHAFVRLARAFEVQPVLMTQPFADVSSALTPDWADEKAQTRFNAMIREVASEEGVLLIDLSHYLQESVPEWNRPMEVFYDAIHVTDKGSTLYADQIAARLLPLVRNVAGVRRSTPAAASTVAPQG